jgi:2-dehydropantoate 2-reductase
VSGPPDPERADPERIAVIGAGSVGCMLGAYLAAAGRAVVLCGRDPLERLVMTIDGETVEHKVAWAADPADLPPLRCAVLATKIHHTPDVAGWLAALPADGIVLAAQNGVDHRARIRPLTAAAVVPVLVYSNARRTGPGEVTVTPTGRGIVVPDDASGRAAAAFFAGSGLEAEVVADFVTALWQKLLVNVMANPLTALTGRTTGELFEQPAMAGLGMDLALETLAVARAEGAALTADDARKALAWFPSLRGTRSSMLQDRLAGRTMEHRGLFDPVLALGERHGVPTPLTRALLALLDALGPQ